MTDQPRSNSVEKFAQPEGRAAAIPPLNTTVAAFIGRCQRGPINTPVVVQNYDGFRRIFGASEPYSAVNDCVLHYFQNGGQLAAVVRVANRAQAGVLHLAAGEESLKLRPRNPGTRELIRASIDYDGVAGDDEFNLVIQRISKQGSQLVEDQESYRSVSLGDGSPRMLVDLLSRSALAQIVGPLPAGRPQPTVTKGAHGNTVTYVTAMEGASDGDELTDYDIIGSADEKTGLFALDRVPRIDFVCLPTPPSGRDVGVTSLVAAARYCERRRAVLVVDPPVAWTSPEAAVLGLRSRPFEAANALTYFPRIRPRDGAGRYPNGTSAAGAICGLLARGDLRQGTWRMLDERSGALRGGLLGVVDTPDTMADLLNLAGVNVLARNHSVGFHFRGDCLMAEDPAWGGLGLASRRLVLRVIDALERGGRWARSETDLAANRDLARQASFFLLDLHEQGALEGLSPEEAFFVRGLKQSVGLRVGLALRRPAEFTAFEIRQESTGAELRWLQSSDPITLVG